MEAIIKVEDGNNIESGRCFFCNQDATYIFGVIDSNNKKFNGYPLNGFHVCKIHMDAINRLLDGTYDIKKMINNPELTNFRGGINFHDE